MTLIVSLQVALVDTLKKFDAAWESKDPSLFELWARVQELQAQLESECRIQDRKANRNYWNNTWWWVDDGDV